MRTYHNIATAVSLATMIGTIAQAQAGDFSRDCARARKSVAITLIEDHGAAGDVSSDRLGRAGLTMLSARLSCYEGRVGGALALYDSILNLGPVASLTGQGR